jgi:hypothetical protein
VATLITVDEAKVHLKIFDAAHDVEVGDKLAQAEGFIAGYLADEWDPAWDATTLPGEVKAAILVYLTLLYVHRDDWADQGIEQGTHEGIANLLRRRRAPVIA